MEEEEEEMVVVLTDLLTEEIEVLVELETKVITNLLVNHLREDAITTTVQEKIDVDKNLFYKY